MKFNVYLLLGSLLFMSSNQIDSKKSPTKAQQLLELLSITPQNLLGLRAPTPPSSLTTSIGSVIFQGYNGGSTTPYTQGANITAFYGASIAPTPGTTMPANILYNTVPAVNSAPTPRFFVGSNGRIGIGNFSSTQGSSINAALHVEGNNNTGSVAAGAGNAMFIGPRTTTLNSFVTAATGSTQVQGNMYVGQTMQTPKLTGYGVFDPLNWTPLRDITSPITINDFPYTINAPGKYALYQDETNSSNPAITINASNVVLDLQGFRLQSLASGTIVQINGNLTNVTIRNGEIKGDGTTTNFGISCSSGANDIVLENLIVANTLDSGIIFNGGNNIFIKNVRVRNPGTSVTNSAGIRIFGCNTINLNTILVEQGGVSGIIFNGIFLSSCSNGLLQDVSVVNCTGTTFRAFTLNGANNIILRNCRSIGNLGTTSMDSFFDITTGSSPFCQLYDCISASNTGTTICRNFQNFTNSTYLGCICQDNNNTAGAGTTFRGYNLGNATFAANCICSNTTTNDTAGTATAFSNASSISGFVNCLAFNNCTNNATSTGFSAVTTSTNFLRKCLASNQPRGFGTAVGLTNPVIENVAAATTTAFFNFPAGSNQTSATIANLTALAVQNPWTNTGIN